MALVRIVHVAVAACLSIPAVAQEPSRTPAPDPADPRAVVPPTVFASPFSGYRRFADGSVGPWRDVNDEVGRIGGWKAYAREAYEASKAAQSTPGGADRPPSAPLDPASPKAR